MRGWLTSRSHQEEFREHRAPKFFLMGSARRAWPKGPPQRGGTRILISVLPCSSVAWRCAVAGYQCVFQPARCSSRSRASASAQAVSRRSWPHTSMRRSLRRNRSSQHASRAASTASMWSCRRRTRQSRSRFVSRPTAGIVPRHPLSRLALRHHTTKQTTRASNTTFTRGRRSCAYAAPLPPENEQQPRPSKCLKPFSKT